MINFDDVTGEITIRQSPHHPCIILIIVGNKPIT